MSKIFDMFRPILLYVILLASELPAPTGRYSVGRTSFHWVDSHRPEVMTTTQNDFREIMVYAWYPAAGAGSGASPYLPGIDRLRPLAASVGLDRLFGPIWTNIESNELRSHSSDGAPVIAGSNLPVLVFIAGGGTTPIA